MNERQYRNLMTYFEEHQGRKKLIIVIDSIITKVAYVIYPLLLVWLYLAKNPYFLRATLVPGISFVLLSIFRRIYNAPRPYEVYGIPPAIPKTSKGESFPSRHVFSCFVIAVTLFYFFPLPGCLLMGLGTVMAVVRALGGVHFPKDVAAGAVLGMLMGTIGLWFI